MKSQGRRSQRHHPKGKQDLSWWQSRGLLNSGVGGVLWGVPQGVLGLHWLCCSSSLQVWGRQAQQKDTPKHRKSHCRTGEQKEPPSNTKSSPAGLHAARAAPWFGMLEARLILIRRHWSLPVAQFPGCAEQKASIQPSQHLKLVN